MECKLDNEYITFNCNGIKFVITPECNEITVPCENGTKIIKLEPIDSNHPIAKKLDNLLKSLIFSKKNNFYCIKNLYFIYKNNSRGKI